MSKKRKKDFYDEEDDKTGLGLSSETRNGIYGVVTLGVAILSVLALFGQAGQAGHWFKQITILLFGWGFFLVPFALVLLGISFFKSIHREVNRSAIIGIIFFMLAIMGLFFIWGDSSLNIDQRIVQGGYLGWVLGYVFLKFAGFWASMIVFVLFIVVSILVTLDVSLYRLIFKEKTKQ